VDGGTGQPVQTTIDPATGQVIAIDPATGLPIEGLTAIDAQTANPPIQTGTMVDPATGLPVGLQYDPATGLNYDPATGIQYDPATGLPIEGQIDPATGLPLATTGQATTVQYDANGQAIDPVTGFPLQQQAPVDPETGLPMTLIIDPATGQQVWVPSAPTGQQGQIVPPAQVIEGQQLTYQEPQRQRTLMDLIFGNGEN
jgi:penicillin-binding protein 1A